MVLLQKKKKILKSGPVPQLESETKEVNSVEVSEYSFGNFSHRLSENNHDLIFFSSAYNHCNNFPFLRAP